MEPSTSFTGTIYGGMGRLLYDYLVAEGYPIPPSIANLQNLERFEFSLWSSLLTNLSQSIQRPALGLNIAQHTQAKHLGILGYIGMVCDTLGEAVQRYQDLHQLIFDGTPLELEILGDDVAVRWAQVPMSLMTLVTDEVAMGAMVFHLNQSIDDGKVRIQSVHFAYPEPKDTKIYDDFFGCKVLFNQKKSQVIFPLSEFSRPFHRRDKTLQNLLIQQAEALLERIPHRATKVDHQIQKAILHGLQKGYFQIEHIAQDMHMSVRKLQRLLQQQGTTFQQRVQSIRQMLAQQYLKDPHLSLQEIALLLGYSEQSAFQRAFKQWTQMTPQQWRQNTKYVLTVQHKPSTHHLSFEI